MHNVRSVLAAAGTLMIICALVVAALGVTNLVTEGPIAENERIATEQACKKVLSTATTFEALAPTSIQGVTEVYKGIAADGTTVGYVVKTTTKGKGSDFVMMTGVSSEGAVVGIEVVSNNETAGYVNTVKKGGLFDRLLGADIAALASVDGVSQATKTSGAVLSGVELALAAVEEVSARG